jgi:membrane protease subunit (stomatin/prohibitin family)
MGIFDFLSGEFIDVIHWTDDTRDTMVWRFDRAGHQIKYGAKLTVREGQAAVLVHEGQMADVFTPGLYMLETNTMPVMTRLRHWDHGFRSPFTSEIYFVNTTRFTGLKWGTRNPIMLRDPEFGPTRVRAFGTYTVKVSDPARFMSEIVGTDGAFTMDEIGFQLRNIIVQAFSRVIAASGIPVLDMAANTADLGKLVAGAIAETVAEYGITIPEFYIENISLPPAVEKALDTRTSHGLSGDLDAHMKHAAPEALRQGGGAAGAMGQQMTGPGGRTGSAPGAPPPPPVEHVWHIAENGQTSGPFSKADMGRMAQSGALRRDSHVWTPGQDGWMRAEDVADLARLFTVMPPPPPPPG